MSTRRKSKQGNRNPRLATCQAPSLEFRVAQAATGVVLVLCSTGCLHRRQHPAASQQPYPRAQRPVGVAGRAPAPASAPGRAPASAPAQAEIVQGEEGIASWYGHPFHGRSTSSGEIYNMYDMTAAHRTLPFGTQVRVHDLENGQSVDVRINDRGPFIEGRIIDLSYSAAQAMGMIASGTALVRLEILNPAVPGPAAEPGVYAVQVGAFRDHTNAERLKARIESQFGPVVIQSFDRGDGLFHRVRVGRETTEDSARSLAAQLSQTGLVTETFIVRLN